MHARYERALNERVLPALLPGGAWHFLVAAKPVEDPYALDIQLRERNKLMYYHGTTRVLTIKLQAGTGGMEARAHAAVAYGENPACQAQYRALMKPWTVKDTAAFRAAFLAYLPKAVAAADSRYYGNRQEGYWQNRLCVRLGRQWTPSDEWLVIDRECVVGCNNADEKDFFYQNTRKAYQGIKDALQAGDRKAWGEPDGTAFGDELDLLAISRTGNLVAIELKHGANASGIYWGPLQVGVYHDAFFNTNASIRESIRDLAKQKIALGLLPAAASALLDASSLTKVEPVLAIAEPSDRSTCWQKMERVIAEMVESKLPRPSLPLRIARIREADGDLALAFAPR